MQFGAADAELIEPVHSIVDWFFENPDVSWWEELTAAKATAFTQAYSL
jgi:hypothetical protein